MKNTYKITGDDYPSASFCQVFEAVWHNQYGRPIGYGYGDTPEDAKAQADKDAAYELSRGNPNWKWRKARLRIAPNPICKPTIVK